MWEILFYTVLMDAIANWRNSCCREELPGAVSGDSNSGSLLHNASLCSSVPEAALEPENVFQCRLELPGTDLRLEENLIYYPGQFKNMKQKC